MSKKQIRLLMYRLKKCSVDLAYQIVLKEPKGYDVSELEAKLAYVNTLRSIIEMAPAGCKKVLKEGYIQFCGGKVLPSKNNPLLLAGLDSKGCSEIAVPDSYCVDLCEVESKLSSACINC